MSESSSKPREMRPRLRFDNETVTRLNKICVKEHLDMNKVMERAIQEISDRGFTDSLTKKGII